MINSVRRAAAALALFAAVQFLPIPALLAAGKPLALALAPSAQTVTEGQRANLTLSKSGGNGRVTAARVTTSDGSFSASVLPGTTFTVPTRDDAIVNGTRNVTVIATASSGATARAVITVLDNDVAAPPSVTWTKCADEGQVCTITGTAEVRYGAGTTWTSKTVTGPVDCSNNVFGDPIVGTVKECDTTGTVVAPPPPAPAPSPAPAPAPAPVPPTSNWVPAPLAVGGYACNRLQENTLHIGPCGTSIVCKITGSAMSSDTVPVQQYTATFFQDASGNFPVGDAYAVGFVGTWAASDLIGIAPAP